MRAGWVSRMKSAEPSHKDKIVSAEKQVAALEQQLRSTLQILEDLQAQVGQTRERLSVAKRRLADLRYAHPGDLWVTEHALLRYLARHHGVDVVAAEKEIREIIAGVPPEMQATEVHFKGFVLRGNRVITYME